MSATQNIYLGGCGQRGPFELLKFKQNVIDLLALKGPTLGRGLGSWHGSCSLVNHS